MSLDAWLPIGMETPDASRITGISAEGPEWQLYAAKANKRVLVVKSHLASRWEVAKLIPEGAFAKLEFGDATYFTLTSDSQHIIAPLEDAPSPHNKGEALAFAQALNLTREIDKETSLHDGIYIEKLSRILPTYTPSIAVKDDVILGYYLSGGVPVSVHSTRRLMSLTGWLGADNLTQVISKSGISLTEKIREDKGRGDKPKFSLAGREELEQFLLEHIIDIVENAARYKALGISSPSAVILHGPPGCGKTYAIEKLVEYLEWPSYYVEASSVASPYIHETSKKVAQVFEKAIQNAPSIIVIDEMEAFLTNRQSASSSGQHHVEEVAEFLRRIPEAIASGVLVVGMTNQIDMIDPAILRRGRFDHVIKVDMASEEEILSLLEKLVGALPQEPGIDLKPIAKAMKGRPLSDVAFLIREAARVTARSGLDKISQEILLQALESSPARTGEPPARKIGFM